MTSARTKCRCVLALLSSLPACHLLTHPSHQQAAITAYVVRTIDDPDSYQARWWGTPRVVSRTAKVRLDRLATLRRYATAQQKAWADSVAYPAASTAWQGASSAPRVLSEGAYRRFVHAASTRDSLAKILRHQATSPDTARYGYLIAHGYQARNRRGQLFRDSALFLVDVEANVTVWDALKQPIIKAKPFPH